MVMITLTFNEFFEGIEEKITSTIQNIKQDDFNDWDEDFITRTILSKLRANFKEVEITSAKKFIYIKTQCFKYTKKLSAEQKYGDIAILMKIGYDDDRNEIEGVGLIEAKKRYRNGKFTAIKSEQLHTIYQNAPHSYMMLYDFDRIDLDNNFKDYLKAKNKLFPKPVYASLVPVNLAKEFTKIDRNIYRFSTAFSYQFAYRYIYGLDLEFSQDSIETARGYRLEERCPKNILLVSVQHSKTKKESIDIDFPNIETQNFEIL